MAEQAASGETAFTLALKEASSADTSREQLTALTRHEAPEIRAAVAGNPRLLTGVLTKLAQDSDKRVRAAVAAH